MSWLSHHSDMLRYNVQLVMRRTFHNIGSHQYVCLSKYQSHGHMLPTRELLFPMFVCGIHKGNKSYTKYSAHMYMCNDQTVRL